MKISNRFLMRLLTWVRGSLTSKLHFILYHLLQIAIYNGFLREFIPKDVFLKGFTNDLKFYITVINRVPEEDTDINLQKICLS